MCSAALGLRIGWQTYRLGRHCEYLIFIEQKTWCLNFYDCMVRYLFIPFLKQITVTRLPRPSKLKKFSTTYLFYNVLNYLYTKVINRNIFSNLTCECTVYDNQLFSIYTKISVQRIEHASRLKFNSSHAIVRPNGLRLSITIPIQTVPESRHILIASKTI